MKEYETTALEKATLKSLNQAKGIEHGTKGRLPQNKGGVVR